MTRNIVHRLHKDLSFAAMESMKAAGEETWKGSVAMATASGRGTVLLFRNIPNGRKLRSGFLEEYQSAWRLRRFGKRENRVP